MARKRLRFRYRPSKPGRAAAYTVVIVGLVVWLLSGAWRSPAEAGSTAAIPFWTLVLAACGYAAFAFLEKFGFEDDSDD